MACGTIATVQVCYTLVRNVQNGQVVSESVSCGSCPLPAVSFDPVTFELTIHTPLTYHFSVSVNDNLSQSCSLSNITSP